MLRLSLLAVLTYVASAVCPEGFDLVRNGECYKQANDAISLYSSYAASTAVDTCKPFDAGPVIIQNKEDNDYWVGVAKADHQLLATSGNVLLAIECRNDRWQWTDGSAITFKPDGADASITDSCDSSENGWYKCAWTISPTTGKWVPNCNMYTYVDVYCIIPHVEDVEPDEHCGSFSHDSTNDVCYQVGATATTIADANTVCRGFGAQIASIHNQGENNFVRRLAVSRGLVNGLLLGGTITGKKNAFGWRDGTDFDYNNFAKGFPVDGFGECLAMETNNVGGQWINVDCSTELPFACIRQTNLTGPVCDGGLKTEGDIIFSPGFPTNASEPCDFLLKVDTGKLVEVEILFLEANECCDQLVLFEGSLGGSPIAVLSGEKQNGLKFRTTSQNVMRASWQPKGGVNVKGMTITFKGVPK